MNFLCGGVQLTKHLMGYFDCRKIIFLVRVPTNERFAISEKIFKS
jgi:hypothetical protein